MDVFQGAERLMGMSDTTWARHANPWSAYTRIASAPLVFFAAWSGYWIGWWSILAIAGVAAWIWLNPRAFPPPRTAEAWATKGVLGERVFLNRKAVPIPVGFVRAGWLTTAIAIAFAAIAIYGLLYGDFWLAFTGWHAAVLAKIWFVDRCAWLFDVMKDSNQTYAAWARAEWDTPPTES